MNKEYWVVGAVALLILSTVMESIAGPVVLELANPFVFLSQPYFSVYPLTAAAIGVRSLGVLLLVLTAVSTIQKQYFLKALGLLILGVIAELYAVQQVMTEAVTTPLSWTLSFAYAGVLILPAIVYYLLRGALSGVGSKMTDMPEESEEDSEERIKKIKELSEDQETPKESS